MDILTISHWLYFFFTILIFILLIRKKEIVLVCIAGILIVSVSYSKNLFTAVKILTSSVIIGFQELFSVFIGISLILSMTAAIKDTGAVNVIVSSFSKPGNKIKQPKQSKSSFLIIGFLMLIISLMIWPSPAVALMGTFLIPLGRKTGLSPLTVAVAVNLFGHGVALSGDFFIQGVTSITSSGAGLSSNDLMTYLVPLWVVMSVVTITVAFIRIKNNKLLSEETDLNSKETENNISLSLSKSRVIVISIIVLFVIDIVAMMLKDITGDDATYLISGTALVATGIISLISFKFNDASEKMVNYITDGFLSTMKIFTPALIIIAFFSLGNNAAAQELLGEDAPGFISDFVYVIVDNLKIPDFLLAVLQVIIGTIYSIDGSGFAGLTVIGEITNGYAISLEQKKLLISLGQIVIIWISGGTLIPWSVIPVASVCQVKPIELVKQNLIPVVCGLIATTIVASVWLAVL